MKQGEITLAINTCLGWKYSETKTDECQTPALLNGKDVYVNWSVYPVDRNTMALLENNLVGSDKRDLRFKYFTGLSDLTSRGPQPEWERAFNVATADEWTRAEAYLKAHNLRTK